MEAYLSELDASSKKYIVQVLNRRTGQTKNIRFGASGYQDFTIHHDEARRQRYVARHQAREDWTDPLTAGFWSRWLLWNKPTIQSSARDIERRFKIKVNLS